MLVISTGAMAQSGSNQMIQTAKKAARQAGCFSGYNGPIEAKVNVVSICLVSGTVTEVLFVPVCNGPGCENVRLGALSKVTFYCNDETPGLVECL